ncbi:B-type cyclin [Exophiala dermatitidis]|uniref:B-type cyclin n=1 Tax=Exophiala dermatitidis TaxID=5970 RepID=A0AAN6IT42_EXODE|nr:B-type cyclin [Exophiala dermatitidis]KAJ4512405.1 B-type cyclin [Exophiala dermatitidis]KAJ4512721.1 B-type cyclin [Exophiala dermatitidis]KAJ4542525.1 B-type cyclin [Exophiala dermatitidis]KAJ4546550.1 B-type cyclin [Exophiala dermatitidis]
MDVKPQRPLRSIRVKNDENLPPDSHVAKTIHHRNKSSPALTTMAGEQGLKAAPKRTAFGDVSNIAGGTRPSKDDSSLNGKPSLQAAVRAAQPLHERKSMGLIRPQRPRSVSALKNIITGTNNNVTADHPGNTTSENGQVQPQAAITKKTLSKRHTTVFKDVRLTAVQEANCPILDATNSDGSFAQIRGEQETNAEASKLNGSGQLGLTAPRSHIVPEPIKDNHEPRTETSLPSIDEVNLGRGLSSESNNESILKETVTTISDPSAYFGSQQQQIPDVSSNFQPAPLEANATADKKLDAQEMPAAKLVNPVDAVPPLIPHHHTYLARRVEHEEYWDDEDDDNYEEEDYVTARSFRSRGENTTGAATAVLFPQMNQRARKEIAAAKQLVEATRSPEEVEDECYDTSMVAEYGDEIFKYMKQLELKMLPNPHYMENQHEIQWSMRSVLMDWLVQVHLRFNLLPETLFLCVNYIDRFLSCKVVSLGKLQLVGATAIFIAAKYEEINCPSVQEIVYMVDGGYSMDEILKAERFMLTMLQFELGWPGPMSFLRRISKADDYDLETRTLAKYFLEVTLMDERFIGSPPSFTAAASHCLARLMLRKGTWTPHHVHYSGYTYSQLKPLVSLLLECCDDPRKHHNAVFNKYSDKRYKRASAFVETEIHRGFRLPDQAAMLSLPQPQLATYYDGLSYFRA